MNTILTFLKALDKQLHMMGCCILTVTLGYWLTPSFGLMPAAFLAAALTAIVGACKEWYDYKHPLTHTADIMDFAADAIGVSVGSFVLLAPMVLTILKAHV